MYWSIHNVYNYYVVIERTPTNCNQKCIYLCVGFLLFIPLFGFFPCHKSVWEEIDKMLHLLYNNKPTN